MIDVKNWDNLFKAYRRTSALEVPVLRLLFESERFDRLYRLRV